jgi:hypothetical protein
MWIGFIWHRIGTGDRPLWTRQWSVALSKVDKFLTAGWTLKNVLCHVIWEDRNAIKRSFWITNFTHNSFSCMFISIIYMFRVAMWPSSGELIVSVRHLLYTCMSPFGVQIWMRPQSICSCSTTAESSRDGLTGARCCDYSYMCSWWWVELPPEKCEQFTEI